MNIAARNVHYLFSVFGQASTITQNSIPRKHIKNRVNLVAFRVYVYLCNQVQIVKSISAKTFTCLYLVAGPFVKDPGICE